MVKTLASTAAAVNEQPLTRQVTVIVAIASHPAASDDRVSAVRDPPSLRARSRAR
jgi:hypothetical protein